MPYPEPQLPSATLPEKRTISVCYKEKSEVKNYTPEAFEKLFGVRYLTHLTFSSKKCFEKIKDLTTKAIRKETLSKQAERMGVYYRREMAKGAVCPLYIQWIGERVGYGLFAKQPIDKGAFIGEYLGNVRKTCRLFGNVNEYCFRYPLKLFSLFVYTIDAKSSGNETRFMNNNPQNPNCDAIATVNNDLLHICLFANRNIQADEELTFDYGNGLKGKEQR